MYFFKMLILTYNMIKQSYRFETIVTVKPDSLQKENTIEFNLNS